MDAAKADIMARLQREILSLQGLQPVKGSTPLPTGPAAMMDAFPNKTFPLGAVHEFIADTMEDASATAGFVSALLSPILQTGGAIAWIGADPLIFPPALKQFGIEPDRVLFIRPTFKKDLRWVTEEALRCEALSAVISEWSDMSFTESRRLQLAVEKSKVTGCIIRRNPRYLQTTASVSRWKIHSIQTMPADGLPGVGFPRWQVTLLKVRNGKPGAWTIEWLGDRLSLAVSSDVLIHTLVKKTG